MILCPFLTGGRVLHHFGLSAVRLDAIAGDLRKMSSEAAADWLMNWYPAGSPDWGEAILLLPHRSWKRADQVRLAKYYLSHLPFASGRPYEAFASFMQVSLLADILKQLIPEDDDDRILLEYHAGRVLKQAAKTDLDREAVEAFLSSLRAG